jgi:predicted phage terminase large subunit-like protein
MSNSLLLRIQEEQKTRKKKKLSSSYYEFVKAAVQVLEPETDWSFNWHMKYVCDELQVIVERVVNNEQKLHDLLVNVPPGSTKSKIFSVCLVGWVWIHAPWVKIGNHSFNQTLSLDHTMQARLLINSSWYQSLFGDCFEMRDDQNTTSVFSNKQGGERRSGVQTGKHFDLIIIDDPIDPKNAVSEAYRKSALDIYFKVIPSRLKNLKTGVRLLIMQRVHEEDVSGEVIRRNLNYKKIIIPASIDENNRPSPASLAEYYTDNIFWPERFSQSVLEEKKTDLGMRDYSGQYLQIPAPADGEVFKRAWFQFFKEDDVPDNLIRYFYTDSAFGVEGGDHSATLCWSAYRGNMYIWGTLVERLKITKWKEKYKDWVKLMGDSNQSKHFIENKASGHDINDVLREETGLNLIIDKISNEMSKRARAEACTPKIEAGRVFLLEGGGFVDSFVQELLMYPMGRFDDQVDTLSGAIRHTDFSIPDLTNSKKDEVISF